MAKKNNGYLVPIDQPAEFSCMRVYYPNDPLYAAALLGSLSYLGSWVAWERSEDKRAALAAALWKTANEFTYETMSIGCSDTADCDLCDMTREELQAIINEAIEAMTITITNTNNCGCCGGSGGSYAPGGGIPPGFDGSENPDIPPYLGDSDPSQADTEMSDRCAMTHYMLLKWRNLVLSTGSGDLTGLSLNENISGIFGGVWNWVIETASVITRWLQATPFFADTSSILSAIDSNYERLQCAVLQGGSQDEIVSRLHGVIGGMDLSFWVKWHLKNTIAVFPFAGIQYATVTMGINVGDEYYSRGCPDCVNFISELAKINPTTEYELVDITNDVEFVVDTVPTGALPNPPVRQNGWWTFSGITSTGTFAGFKVLDWDLRWDWLDYPDNYWKCVVLELVSDNTDNVKIGGVLHDYSRFIIVGGNVSTTDWINQELLGGICTYYQDTDGDDGDMQINTNTILTKYNSGNLKVFYVRVIGSGT